MTLMLAMVVNELQHNLNEQLPHDKFAHNNSVSAATGLAPTPPSHDFRACWSRWPPELGPRPPRLLGLGDGPPSEFVSHFDSIGEVAAVVESRVPHGDG